MTTERRQARRRPGRVPALVLGLLLTGGAARAAHAQTDEFAPYEPQPMPSFAPGVGPSLFAPPAPVVQTRRWYGYQLILSDLASIALLFAGEPGSRLGGAAFFFAPPTIHAVHRNVSMAVASPLMRIGLPVAGALIGASAESCSEAREDDWCGLGGALAGLGLGLLAAMILDYSLAWEERTVASPRPLAARRPPRVSLTTAGVAPTNSGASLVLGGRF